MRKLILLLCLLPLLSTISCDNDDDNCQGIDCLPPATQTGKGTFACLVNGEPFIDNSGGFFNCFYQLVNGEYFFGIQGSGRVGDVISVALGTEAMQIELGQTYQLLDLIEGNAWAGSNFNPNSSSQENSITNMNFTGELTITNLDFTNQIVSGTFWYDLQNPFTGERVEIRDGRFDTLFTQ